MTPEELVDMLAGCTHAATSLRDIGEVSMADDIEKLIREYISELGGIA